MGARIEKEIDNNGWIGCVQENGWFDGRVGQIWIEKILKPYLRDAEKSFLLVDHFSVHLNSEFVNSVNNLGCDVDFIPAGYTCVLQPVDVGVNATFKKSIRDYHHSWCLENYPKILDKDKFPTPEREDVYDWVVDSFDKVSSESIRKTYKHIGYIEKNAMDQDEEEEQEGVFDNGLENEVEIDEAELLATESDMTTDTSDDEDEFYTCSTY
jgi:hypothetical protein